MLVTTVTVAEGLIRRVVGMDPINGLCGTAPL